MPTLTLPPFSGAIADALTHQVWVRSLWSDPWVELENLRCERLAWSVAPGLSTASFRWRYGRALAWETGAWQAVPKLSLSPRGFIKVTVAGQSLPGSTRNTRDWVGVWNSAVDHDLLQRFSADGVEVLLSYVSIRDAWYVDHFNALRQAGRGLTFNADGLPNRSLQNRPSTASRSSSSTRTRTAPPGGAAWTSSTICWPRARRSTRWGPRSTPGS